MKFCICLLIIMSGILLNAQSVHESLNSACQQLGKYSTKQDNVFFFNGNPAVLGVARHNGFGFYSERKFLLKELNLFNASAQLAFGNGGFGATVGYYGTPLYNELKFGISYGRRLTDDIYFGGQLNFLKTSTREAFASSANASLGAIFKLSPILTAGMSAQNIGSFIKTEPAAAPQYSIGFCYDVSKLVSLSGDLIVASGVPLSLIGGIVYRAIASVEIVLGISSGSSLPFLSCSFKRKQFRLDLIMSYHFPLGLTPGVGLQYLKQTKAP